jgi:hypothetical protein
MMGLPVYQDTSASASASVSEKTHETAAQPPSGAGVNTGAGTTRAKTEEEEAADRLYEEAMEEEYAKREGGS